MADLNRRAGALLEEYGVAVDAGRAGRRARRGDAPDGRDRARAVDGRALHHPRRADRTARWRRCGATVRPHARPCRPPASRSCSSRTTSHEIYEVCETVTVLRDARHITTRAGGRAVARRSGRGDDRREPRASSDRLGRAPDRRRRRADPRASTDLTLAGQFSDVGLAVRGGEVVGIAGSGSSGCDRARPSALFGLRKPDRGTIRS